MHTNTPLYTLLQMFGNSRRQHLETIPCHCLCLSALHISLLTVGSTWQSAYLQIVPDCFVLCQHFLRILYAAKQTVECTVITIIIIINIISITVTAVKCTGRSGLAVACLTVCARSRDRIALWAVVFIAQPLRLTALGTGCVHLSCSA